jgi:hypothetical protein
MNGDKLVLTVHHMLVLIAHHMLETIICACMEWLANELMMTANKIEYKDAR